MFVQPNYLNGITGTGTIPAPALIVSAGMAWLLLAGILAVCCAALWLLTKPGSALATETSPTTPRGRRTRASRPASRAPLSLPQRTIHLKPIS